MAVTASMFRALALSQGGAVENAIEGGASFSLDDKVFALLIGKTEGALMLSPEQQKVLCAMSRSAGPSTDQRADPGQTNIALGTMELPLLADYVGTAYRNIAPRQRLVF